jgi:hypothetical protein
LFIFNPFLGFEVIKHYYVLSTFLLCLRMR